MAYYSRTRKFIMAVWAVVETVLFGGLIFGWGSIVFVLKDSGVYSYLCNQDGEDSVTGCSAQDSRLSLVFAIDSALYGVGCAVIGQINYRYGTRVTRIISSLIFITGTLLMTFESPSIPWLVFPGLACIGIGGIPLFITNAQIGNLFETGGSTFVAMLSGAVSMSAIIELIAKVAYEHGFSTQKFYLLLTGLYSMTFVSTFIFLPKDFITKTPSTLFDKHQKKQKDEPVCIISYVINKDDLDDKNKAKDFHLEDMNRNKLEIEYDTEKPFLPLLKHCILSHEYLLQVYWFSILQLIYLYFLSSLNPWLNQIFHGDEVQVSYFTNLLLYLMMGNFILSPIVGALYDWFQRYYKDSSSKKRREMMPAVIPLMCGSALGLILTILMSLPASTATLYPIFTIVVTFRSFVYSSPASVFSAVFPAQYFGSLFGIMIVSAGLIGLLQFALFTWAESTSFIRVWHCLVFLVCTTLIHPLIQWRGCRRMEESMKKVPDLLKS
ncbi:hypothetical protein LOTGIDRAFT_154058 [Lottia gigantea]|uniref:Major facilitator superfamily (MFS) profile domain-containing protein n=1 Tax=Lottia gigantea TaxID=225164 RepID=V3ZD14_LOTGI|nr:hypothetical protein LOTGIDRAFT_154058 [Lottia gigantea]ESO88988.1 hypothetical protein LOTGIDRAFT_154058 [Lottia gigantea]